MEYLNKYTRENNLVLNLDNIKPKYLCQLCRGVLCEPRVTKCKCSFCEACISSYASSTAERTLLECPNCGKVIDKIVEIFPNVLIEDKLEDLQLECPRSGCNKSVALKCMPEHLEECTRCQETCPLARFGCGVMVGSSSELNAHLVNDLGRHFDLVTRQIDEEAHLIHIMQNINSEQLKRIEDGDRALNEAKVEIENLKKINQTLQEKLTNVESEFNTMKNEVMNAINNFTKELSEKSKEIDSYNQEIEKLKKKTTNLEVNLEQKRKRSEDLPKLDTSSNSIASNTSEIIPQEFVFTFNDIVTKEMNTNYFSEICMVNDYLFKTSMLINLNLTVRLCVLSLTSQKVDELIWPIPFSMSLKVMNKYGIIIRTKTFSCATAKFKTDYDNPKGRELYLNNSRVDISLSDVQNECSVIFSVL